jgi:hypothetical protein
MEGRASYVLTYVHDDGQISEHLVTNLHHCLAYLLPVAAISLLFSLSMMEKIVAAIIHVKETAWFPSRLLLNLCRYKYIRRFKQCHPPNHDF